jgi:hypothetical protein
VAVRQRKPFEPGVFDDHAVFRPLARAVRALGPHDDFPSLRSLERVFEGRPIVRFVPPRPRRRRAPIDAAALYDARIVVDGAVPTRARCWHDLMNALVWGTFPRAKGALHARQHRLIAARIAPEARGLPPRTPALDALALLDEGGIVVTTDDPDAVEADLRSRRAGCLRSLIASRAADAVVFGHAIYESVALGVKPAIVAAIVLGRDDRDRDVVRATDTALASALEDETRFLSPRDLMRVDLGELAPQKWPTADSP